MDLQFQKQEISFLRSFVNQVQNLEQTQELRIPEGMPGAERVVLCRGQVLIRSKEWSRDSIRASGGVQVWLLYIPEDGSQPRQLETWIPFQMDWDLPKDCPEGRIRLLPRLRYADARLISAGRLLIRVGVGVLAQGWAAQHQTVYSAADVPDTVQLLQETIPVQLPKEAGEKHFELEETLSLPASVPKPDRLLYFCMDPVVTDQRVLSGKLVFRGHGNLHLMYQCEDGGLQSWDTELPFSQYVQLENAASSDAQADVMLAVTSLELEPEEEGNIRIRASLTAQYLVDDRELLELVSDVWCPFRETELQRAELSLPAVLDRRQERVHAEHILPVASDTVPDTCVLVDFPRQRREGERVVVEQTAVVQLLYYDRDGQLHSAEQRLGGSVEMKAHEATDGMAVPLSVSVSVTEKPDTLEVQMDLPVDLLFSAGQGMTMVTGASLGDLQEPDPDRPSLILLRAGGQRLWDIARESGSTVAAIRAANSLEGEPEQGRMLLIPVV